MKIIIPLFLVVLLAVSFSCNNGPKKWADGPATGAGVKSGGETITTESAEEMPAVEAPAAVVTEPSVSFDVSSVERSRDEATYENPVDYITYMNTIAVRVNGKKYVLDNYKCTLHGAGECGQVGRGNFEPNQLVLPRRLTSKKILREAIVGSDIERAYYFYNRYLAVFEDEGVSVYQYKFDSNGTEVQDSDVKRIRRIEL
ncbi:MAG: hypothetical protein ACKOKF_07085 [Bacteroidota bacterium]